MHRERRINKERPFPKDTHPYPILGVLWMCGYVGNLCAPPPARRPCPQFIVANAKYQASTNMKHPPRAKKQETKPVLKDPKKLDSRNASA